MPIPSSPDEILHRGRYSYRKTTVLIAGVAVTLITGGFGLHLLLANRHRLPRGAEEWISVLFVGGILGLLFICGVFLAASYFRNYALELVITHEGIRYGKRDFPWADVRWIAGTWNKDRYQLVIGRRGFRPDQHLMTDHGLDEKSFERLMETLRNEVAPAHPTVTIAGDQPAE